MVCLCKAVVQFRPPNNECFPYGSTLLGDPRELAEGCVSSSINGRRKKQKIAGYVRVGQWKSLRAGVHLSEHVLQLFFI